MILRMRHEPFYVSGRHSAPELGVYAGWVAFSETAATSQPILNEAKDISLLFSGECFPEPDIQRRYSHCGNEGSNDPFGWLVDAYEKQGDEFIGELNGLFSGLLIDRRARRAVLFNDRFGFDRVYYHEHGDDFYFASEVAPLLAVLPHLREFDQEGLVQYLAVGCTLREQTLFRGIRLLPGAALWSFANGRTHRGIYFDPATWEAQPVLSPGDYQDRFQAILPRIVPRYFQSRDSSKVGFALTAGLDSRMVLACRPATNGPATVSYTYGGRRGQMRDARIAATVSAICRIPHQVIRVGDDFFNEFSSNFDHTVRVTSGCFGLLGTHEIYFNRRARQLAPIRLTGVCGGEILREVCTFKPMRLAPGLLAPEFAGEVAARARDFAAERAHPVTFAAFREIPWNIHGTLAACRSQVTFRTPYLDNELVALAYQAPASVRASSASAVEFIRHADPELASVPTDMEQLGRQKSAAATGRKVMAKVTFKLDYLCNEGLPSSLSWLDPLIDWSNRSLGLPGQHKYLWYRRWFRRELASWLRDQLADSASWQLPACRPEYVRDLAERHIAGRQNLVRELNAALTLAKVRQLFFQA
jgi:asparagine synthase (glutamine-hydrolysing)